MVWTFSWTFSSSIQQSIPSSQRTLALEEEKTHLRLHAETERAQLLVQIEDRKHELKSTLEKELKTQHDEKLRTELQHERERLATETATTLKQELDRLRLEFSTKTREEFSTKTSDLAAREADLTTRDKELAEKAADLCLKGSELILRSTELDQRESTLAERAAETGRLAAELKRSSIRGNDEEQHREPPKRKSSGGLAWSVDVGRGSSKGQVLGSSNARGSDSNTYTFEPATSSSDEGRSPVDAPEEDSDSPVLGQGSGNHRFLAQRRFGVCTEKVVHIEPATTVGAGDTSTVTVLAEDGGGTSRSGGGRERVSAIAFSALPSRAGASTKGRKITNKEQNYEQDPVVVPVPPFAKELDKVGNGMSSSSTTAGSATEGFATEGELDLDVASLLQRDARARAALLRRDRSSASSTAPSKTSVLNPPLAFACFYPEPSERQPARSSRTTGSERQDPTAVQTSERQDPTARDKKSSHQSSPSEVLSERGSERSSDRCSSDRGSKNSERSSDRCSSDRGSKNSVGYSLTDSVLFPASSEKHRLEKRRLEKKHKLEMQIAVQHAKAKHEAEIQKLQLKLRRAERETTTIHRRTE